MLKAASFPALLKALKQHALTVYCIARHPATSLVVRLLALSVAAYAFSPIDLIPDFIPVLGYLDDIIIVPLGCALVIRLTPAGVLQESRDQAVAMGKKPISYMAAFIIFVIWLSLLWLSIQWLVPNFS